MSSSREVVADGLYFSPVPKSEWQKDKAVSACPACETKFDFFKRRHHCRCCGKIFCNNCCFFDGLIGSEAARICSSCKKVLVAEEKSRREKEKAQKQRVLQEKAGKAKKVKKKVANDDGAAAQAQMMNHQRRRHQASVILNSKEEAKKKTISASKTPTVEKKRKKAIDTKGFMDAVDLVQVQPMPKERWAPDRGATTCTDCSDEFDRVRRKHHCRGCGQIFCTLCCNDLGWQFDINDPFKLCADCWFRASISKMKQNIHELDRVARVKDELGMVKKETKYMGASYTKQPPAEDEAAASSPAKEEDDELAVIDPEDF